jgi:hypothetical protein
MAKLADAADLKSAGPKRPVGVRFPLPAPQVKANPFVAHLLGRTTTLCWEVVTASEVVP